MGDLISFTNVAQRLNESTRGKILVVAGLGTAAPALALLAGKFSSRAWGPDWALFSLAACGLVCFLCIAVIARLLSPLRGAADTMQQLAISARLDPSQSGPSDDLARLSQTIEHLAARFDTLGGRLLNQHPITGFPTREPFLEEIAIDMARSGEPTLLALVRLCAFDRMAAFDRGAAESALRAFGVRLGAAVRKSVRLAQVDRDCFAIWFRSTTPAQATNELRAIGYVLDQDLCTNEFKMSPEVTLGAAVFPDDAGDAAALLGCAVAALPQHGASQASNLAFFSPISSEAARQRFVMEQSLRGAIGQDQFILHYQPIVDLTHGRSVGAEALLRWRHPELGLVPPAEFIPILEQSGLIDEVGLWVLNTASREARAWRNHGLKNLKMAINLSALQFRPTLPLIVVRTIERHGLAPSDLEVELTETAAMQDSAQTRDVLRQLHDLGLGIAIDDFGAGYSSLSYLKNLPFTKLKIDREFVVKVHERPESQAICSALIALARGLNIELLAEGVEESEEIETLVGLGCSMFQGYYFSKPLPAAGFIEAVSIGSELGSRIDSFRALTGRQRQA